SWTESASEGRDMALNRDPKHCNSSSAAWPFQFSDALWSRLWHLLREQDQPPRSYETEAQARALVMAMLYRALTGVAWADLPQGAPPPNQVRAAYQRWEEQGLLNSFSELLHVQLTDP